MLRSDLNMATRTVSPQVVPLAMLVDVKLSNMPGGWQAKEEVDRLSQLTKDRSTLAFGSAMVCILACFVCCQKGGVSIDYSCGPASLAQCGSPCLHSMAPSSAPLFHCSMHAVPMSLKKTVDAEAELYQWTASCMKFAWPDTLSQSGGD